MKENGLLLATAKMRAEGLSNSAIESFARAWRRVAAGERGLISEDDLDCCTDFPTFSDILNESYDPQMMDKLCVIKLNGGLGTSMGLDRAKSLISVKDDLTFLDLIAQQILWKREHYGTHGPRFLLMNSFSTSADSLNFLSKYTDLAAGRALEFLQNKVPKLSADSLAPIEWQQDPSLEWCPPGHGDLYAALAGSGTLDELAADGIEFLFVSNSDNLGATADPRLLQFFAESGLSFLMEVAERTAMDRKGGHLARRRSDGRLILREMAQCPEEHSEHFQNIDHHRFFNTNSLWLRVADLQAALTANGGVLPLPLITNSKTVDPRDAYSPAVLQLESAMGAAIECFEKSSAISIPRTRFAPVKTTGDLLALRSDAYVITPDRRLELVEDCEDVPPEVLLDGKYYKLLADLEVGFGSGAPSLRHCKRFEVQGPWIFEKDVVCTGSVEFINKSSQRHVCKKEEGPFSSKITAP